MQDKKFHTQRGATYGEKICIGNKHIWEENIS